jgi:hypothetical protein
MRGLSETHCPGNDMVLGRSLPEPEYLRPLAEY